MPIHYQAAENKVNGTNASYQVSFDRNRSLANAGLVWRQKVSCICHSSYYKTIHSQRSSILQMSSNFCMWPSTSENNIPPYLSLLVSLSFSRNNVCKNAVFFLAVSFPKKALVFPNNRISEARICCQGWFKKISRKRKTKQQKKLQGNVYFLN